MSTPLPDRQAIGSLDKANADVEALERLASFLGTLFVKNKITETDEKVLAAAAKRRPKLKGELVNTVVTGRSNVMRGPRSVDMLSAVVDGTLLSDLEWAATPNTIGGHS